MDNANCRCLRGDNGSSAAPCVAIPHTGDCGIATGVMDGYGSQNISLRGTTIRHRVIRACTLLDHIVHDGGRGLTTRFFPVCGGRVLGCGGRVFYNNRCSFGRGTNAFTLLLNSGIFLGCFTGGGWGGSCQDVSYVGGGLSNSTRHGTNTLLSCTRMFLGIVIKLLCAPIVLQLVNRGRCKLCNAMDSTITLLKLLSLNFADSCVGFCSGFGTRNERSGVGDFGSLFFIIFTTVSLVSLVVNKMFTTGPTLLFSGKLDTTRLRGTNVVVLLLALSATLNFLYAIFGYCVTTLRGFIFLGIFSLTSAITAITLGLTILCFNNNTVKLAIITLTLNILIGLVGVVCTLGGLGLGFSFSGVSFNLFGDIFTFSKLVTVGLFISGIGSKVSDILLNEFYNAIIITICTMNTSIGACCAGFSATVSNIFAPCVRSLIGGCPRSSVRRHGTLARLFIGINELRCVLLTLVNSNFIFFKGPFVQF